MVGRNPIGEQALTKTERQQRWRRKKAIVKEELKRFGIVSGSSLMVDQKMLLAFQEMATELPETTVHDLIFLAMRSFLNADEARQEYAERQGVENLNEHLFMLKVAQMAAHSRLVDEFEESISTQTTEIRE